MPDELRNLNLSSTAVSLTAGHPAPPFSLLSIQGQTVQLAQYAGRRVVLWFSRGFTCPFCRSHMDLISDGYAQLAAQNVEVIQVAPNLHHSAITFFGDNLPPYPFVCDPDKRLFATYGIGDQGVIAATRNTVVAFATAAQRGEFAKTTRASALDVVNRNFLRRLHHHALTALNQAVFLIDRQQIIRHRLEVGALETIPAVPALLQLLDDTAVSA